MWHHWGALIFGATRCISDNNRFPGTRSISPVCPSAIFSTSMLGVFWFSQRGLLSATWREVIMHKFGWQSSIHFVWSYSFVGTVSACIRVAVTWVLTVILVWHASGDIQIITLNNILVFLQTCNGRRTFAFCKQSIFFFSFYRYPIVSPSYLIAFGAWACIDLRPSTTMPPVNLKWRSDCCWITGNGIL